MTSPIPPLSLMIVDDDQDAHFLLTRTLRDGGFINPVVSIEGGENAVQYFQKCLAGECAWPAVIFLDIKMPGMGGFDVLTWLRARNALGNTVIAMMTSSDAPQDVSRAFRLGAHTFLNKGARADTLRPIVESALRLLGQPGP